MAWMIVSDSSCEIRELKNPAPGVQLPLYRLKSALVNASMLTLPR